VRVVAGTHRGRRIAAPPGRDTRPTSDRVREAVFAIVGPLEGARVLDLFAGSGAMGIEALSRGAASALFVDRDARAAAAVRANLASLGLAGRARVVAADWRAALRGARRAGDAFDLCVVDPPYSVLAPIADTLADALGPVLAADAVVVVEGPAADPAPTLGGLPVAERTERTYGATRVVVARTGQPR
jgi:16S rRNA (guanine966-N2)-methyltransferase